MLTSWPKRNVNADVKWGGIAQKATNLASLLLNFLSYKMEAWELSFSIYKLESIHSDLDETVNSLYDAIRESVNHLIFIFNYEVMGIQIKVNKT